MAHVEQGGVDAAALTAVALDDVARVLEIYVEAMLARPADVRPLADLRTGDRSRVGHIDLEGAAAVGRPTTDGAAFYLPERIDRLPDSYGNFMVYRMAVLHQLGGVLFGTYRRGPVRFADFFAGFDEPGLARALFARLEGARIDAALSRVFRGVGRDLLRLIDDALDSSLSPASRPPARRQPREAALFDLARALLVEQRSRLAGDPANTGSPSQVSVRRPSGRHSGAAALLNPGATVDHTLRAVRALYTEFAALRSASSLSEPAPAADDGDRTIAASPRTSKPRPNPSTCRRPRTTATPRRSEWSCAGSGRNSHPKSNCGTRLSRGRSPPA